MLRSSKVSTRLTLPSKIARWKWAVIRDRQRRERKTESPSKRDRENPREKKEERREKQRYEKRERGGKQLFDCSAPSYN